MGEVFPQRESPGAASESEAALLVTSALPREQSTQATPPGSSFLPRGVNFGLCQFSLKGPVGHDLLEQLGKAPWLSNPLRLSEWTQHIEPIPGLVIHAECLACGTCGSAYGTQFIVNGDLRNQHKHYKRGFC